MKPHNPDSDTEHPTEHPQVPQDPWDRPLDTPARNARDSSEEYFDFTDPALTNPNPSDADSSWGGTHSLSDGDESDLRLSWGDRVGQFVRDNAFYAIVAAGVIAPASWQLWQIAASFRGETAAQTSLIAPASPLPLTVDQAIANATKAPPLQVTDPAEMANKPNLTTPNSAASEGGDVGVIQRNHPDIPVQGQVPAPAPIVPSSGEGSALSVPPESMTQLVSQLAELQKTVVELQTQLKSLPPTDSVEPRLLRLQETLDQLTAAQKIPSPEILEQLAILRQAMTVVLQELKTQRTLEQVAEKTGTGQRSHAMGASRLPQHAETGRASAALRKPPLQGWVIEAMLPTRAWLRSKSGQVYTVAPGDELPQAGRVERIDPVQSLIMTSKGIIRQ